MSMDQLQEKGGDNDSRQQDEGHGERHIRVAITDGIHAAADKITGNAAHIDVAANNAGVDAGADLTSRHRINIHIGCIGNQAVRRIFPHLIHHTPLDKVYMLSFAC